MDIAGFSMLGSQAKMMQQVALAVTKLSMDSAKETGANMTKMLEQSVQPGKGASIDIKV